MLTISDLEAEDMEQVMMALTGPEEEEKEEPGNIKGRCSTDWNPERSPAARRQLPIILRNLVVISRVCAPERFIQHF